MAINVNAPATTGTVVDWADITNKPNCFPPCVHGYTHPSGQADPVPLVTPSASGLIPPPPTGSGANEYFGGDLVWHNLASQSSQIVTTGGPGLVPALPAVAGEYFSGASPAGYKKVDYSELTGVPASFSSDWATITNKPACFTPCPHGATHDLGGSDPVYPDWTQIQNKPGTYPPGPHAPTHVTGGSDVIPSANTTIAGLLNKLSGNASDYVGGDNACHSLLTALVGYLIPTGTVLDFAGTTAPAGFLLLDGSSYATSQYPALFALIGYTFGGSGAAFNVPDFRGRVAVGMGQGPGLSLYALGATGGQETHTLTAAELAVHSHIFNDVTHNHPDPTHNHQFNDPTHSHGVNQTPHSHQAAGYNSINYGTTSPGYTFYEATSNPTAAANANISIAASGTGGSNSPSGCGLGPAATGCSVGNNNPTGGGAHENRQPYLAMNRIIKT